jgi:uncharacterized protein (TIGR03437 family)
MRVADALLLFAVSTGVARADLLVSSRDTMNILDYNETTGAYIGMFNQGGGLTGPEALTFGPDGNLYVADRYANTIASFDGKTGAFLKDFVPAGVGGLSEARDLAFGPDGNLYVSSNGNNTVLVYNGTTGAFLKTFAAGPNLGPRGITFQGGELFLASENLNIVLHYTLSSGALIGTFANDPAISSPREIIFGPDGNMYVSVVGTNSVLQLNGSTGALIKVFATTNLNYPRGLAFGPDGNLYVANADANNVLRFNGTTGAYMDIFTNGGVSSFLSGVAFTPRVTPPPPAGPSISEAVSASAFGGFTSVAPGSWVEIYGSNLAPSTQGWTGADFTGNNAPTMLDGVSVSIGGQAAFVDYVSAAQVNAQLPSNISTGGALQLTVTNANGASTPVNITVNATEPGLLAPASFKIGANQYAVAQFSDGTYVLPAGAIANVNSRPAKPGETIVIYGVGFGSVTPNIPAGEIVTEANQLSAPFEILFGKTSAQLPYFGLAPSFVGLYQFNVTVPSVANNDLVPLTFNLGGVAGGQTLFTAVQQ